VVTVGWQVQIVNSGSHSSELNWKTGLNFGTRIRTVQGLGFREADPVLELELEPKSRTGTGIFENNVSGQKWFKTVG
jgi:hypothetical protein